jgi:Ca-activated chloride channel family protein
VVLAALLGAAPAAAQEEQRSVLIILDGSKSMNEPAGDGGTRLDAAKRALRELVPNLPPDANVGLRVYGSRLSEVSRARACRDTELVAPVAPLDAAGLQERIEALEGRGRTPIGRSLEAAADDLPPSGRRIVVLVSDGGDNCAPPDPCRAAARVARGGIDLSISVVGLQVTPRVERQLRCIAEAGGGAYVDADDADALRDQLLAALARAFRSYEPSGTPVNGAVERPDAPVLGEGQYLDEIRPGETRHYAVRVPPGRRLSGALTLALPRSLEGRGTLNVKLVDPTGEEVVDDSGLLGYDPFSIYGNIVTEGVDSGQTAAPGVASDAPSGVWRIELTVDQGDLSPTPIPLELALQVLEPNEVPGLVREPGPRPGPPAPRAEASPSPSRSATPEPDSEDGGGAAVWLAAAVGLVAGGVGGFGAMRRRRRS